MIKSSQTYEQLHVEEALKALDILDRFSAIILQGRQLLKISCFAFLHTKLLKKNLL